MHFFLVVMVRTRIEVNISCLGVRTKTMSVIVGSKSTTSDVIHKVLEKFHRQESQEKFQLLAVAKNDAGSQGKYTHMKSNN